MLLCLGLGDLRSIPFLYLAFYILHFTFSYLVLIQLILQYHRLHAGRRRW